MNEVFKQMLIPVYSTITRSLFSLLRSDKASGHIAADASSDRQSEINRQAECIEAAVASVLVVYIGWICFRGWYFEEPIFALEHMFRGSLLVITAALGGKLFWVIWSKLRSG